jgi:hypothetical protein
MEMRAMKVKAGGFRKDDAAITSGRLLPKSIFLFPCGAGKGSEN